MSSWLSSNLTGSLSSISNLTGQISSFTREILTEGVEEVSDPSAELQVAQARINELEAHLLTQRAEYERLKQNNEELHVRLEASELQTNSISKEYRAQLHNKEQELIKLRELSRFHEEQGHSFGRRERHDSTDSIDDSMEAKRLHSEISKLQAECQHWKSVAHGAENQDKLHKEIDQYQHELTALQSSYSQKIASLNKKHKQEFQKWQDEREEYAQRIEELEQQLLNQDHVHEAEVNDHNDFSHGQSYESANVASPLNKQLVAAEQSIKQLKSQVKAQEERMNALNAELQEKEDVIHSMQKDLDNTQAKCEESTKTHNQAMSASENKLNVSLRQMEKLQTQLEDQSKELKVLRSDSDSLSTLEKQFHIVATENAELKEVLNHTQSEERRLHRCVEEVKSELEQLSGSTMDLMEELQISQGLQQEQKIEMENLKKVKYIKGEAKQEMGKLRSALAALWERHLCLVQLYQQVRQELHNSNARLVAMFQARHLSTNAVREDVKELQQRLVKRSQAKLEHVVKEKDALMSRSAELRVTVEELEGAVMDLQSDNEQVAQETKYCVTEIGRQQGMDEEEEEEEGSDIVAALHAEKAVLESTIVGLEHKVQDLQELVNTLQRTESAEGQPSPSGSAESLTESIPRDTPLEPEIRQEAEVSLEEQTSTISQELQQQLEDYQQQVPEIRQESEASLEEQVTTISQELQQQLQDYQQQVQEFELAQSDWEGEKDALEGVVLSLRRQVKELQGLLGNSSVEQQEITRLQHEKAQIISEKEHILDAWKTLEADFVSLNISSPHIGNAGELDRERMELLRADLNKWALGKSQLTSPALESSNDISVNEGSQTEEGFNLYLTKLQEFEKDNSLLREQTERLIQEIEEKTSEVADVQSELETRSAEVKLIREEKQGLMTMINDRDERICELEESFNAHLLDLTASKDNEINLLQTGQEDVVKLLEENKRECSLLRTRNNELVDMMGQTQLAYEELGEQNKTLAILVAEREKHIESMKGEKDNLDTMLQDKEQANLSLAAENNSLLMEKEVLQSLLEEYKDKVKARLNQTAEISKLQEVIEHLNRQVQTNEDRCKAMEAKHITLSREKDSLEVELQQTSSKSDNFACELKEKFSEIEMLRVENSKLSDVVQNQVSACKNLERELSESIREKEEVTSRLGMKDLQVDKLELDLREKGADVDLLKLEIAKLSKALKEKEQLIHTQVVNASSSDDARYQQAQLLRLLEAKDQEIAALKQKDASLIELVSRTDEDTHRAQEAYENKLQELREERDRLLADLSLRDEELLNADDRLEAMREKMQGKDQASHLLHTEHARLLALNESQANEMGKLRERNSSLQKLVEERSKGQTAEQQRIQDENTKLRRQMSALQVEHETLSTLIHEKDKQIAALAQLGSAPEPSPHGADMQVKILREERDVLLRERDSIFREKEMKEKEISQLQQEIFSLRQTIEEKRKLAASAIAENEDLCKQLASLQSQLDSMDKSNLVRSDNRVRELQDEIISFKRVIENKDKELKQVLENSRNEKSLILVELESIKSERDDILEQKDVETSELKNKILQLVNSISDCEPSELENADDVDKNFQTLLHTVKNQRNNALRERDNEIQSLREQLSNVTLLNKADHDSGLEEVLRDKEELHRMLLQERDEKQDLIREKESVVADFQDQIVSLSRAVSDKERSSQQDLQRVIQDKERIVKELDQAQRDREEVNSASSQWQAEISRLQAQLHDLRGTLTQEQDTISKLHKEVEQHKMALQEKERIAKELMVEREQLLRTGEQLHGRVQQLQEELTVASSGQKVAETKMAQELERLRNHLVQVEESYTREALEAEEREKDLRMKLARAEEQLLSSSHSMLDRDRQASVQIENLQEQLQALAAQRDRAVMDLASSQEAAHQYQSSVNNLQLVLEQFQRERESQLKGTQEQAQKEVVKAWDQVRELQERESQLKSQLEMAARVTQEVVNMRNQLREKDEDLLRHKQEVARLDEELRVSHERIKSLNSMSDGKVEKSLLKNMLMTYFNTSENKRADVVRVIGGLLGFTHEELQQVGTGSSAPKGSWISNLIPFGHGAPKTPTRTTAAAVEKSFSELFVSFLESESEVPLSGGEGHRRGNLSNPLLSSATHHVLPAAGRPIATSTPVGTPARSNMPPVGTPAKSSMPPVGSPAMPNMTPVGTTARTNMPPSLPPSAISRPATGPLPSVADGLTRSSLSAGTNGNPLLVGSLTPVQQLPALSSSGSSSLRTLLERPT